VRLLAPQAIRVGASMGQRAGRRRYVDNLKVLIIAAIIGGHGVAGYSEFEFWPYSEMKEVELSAVTQGLVMWFVGPLVLVLIPLLFLISTRHPVGVYVVLVQPLVMYPVHHADETPGS